ncbi:hypothetical protein [Streptomyces sp. NPDC053048]|uniref:hypothetical protein n=1 Tax=Streptomyces sp. NPDC053048 TaxID=3365694 RepID=UPI0037D87626
MNPARPALAALAAAALVLTAAADATADPSLSDSESSISSADPAQRGREVVFTVTTGRTTLDDHDGYLTVESPAFAKKLTLKAKRFREGKDGELYTKVAGMVLCDLEPGTYPVDLKDGGEDEPADSVELTVVAQMDPANRDFCDSHTSYEDAVDRTSETAPDEDVDEDEEDEGVGLGELAAVIVGTAALSAVLAATATYLLTRRRRSRDEGGKKAAGPEDEAR